MARSRTRGAERSAAPLKRGFLLNGKRFVESTVLRQSRENPKQLIARLAYPKNQGRMDLRIEISFPAYPKYTCSAEEIQIKVTNSKLEPIRLNPDEIRDLKQRLTVLILRHLH